MQYTKSCHALLNGILRKFSIGKAFRASFFSGKISIYVFSSIFSIKVDYLVKWELLSVETENTCSFSPLALYRNQYIQERSTAKRIVTSPRLHDASLLGELEGTSWHTGSGFKGVSIFGLSTTFQPRPCEKNVWQSHGCSILSLQKNRAVPFLSPLKVITV